MEQWVAMWLGLLTFAGIAYPVWVRERGKRLEAMHHASDVLEQERSRTQGYLIEELQEEVQTMRANRVDDAAELRRVYEAFHHLEVRVLEFEAGIRILLAQLVRHNLEPEWVPPAHPALPE